jgi:GTP pyrophosphokinase
MMVRVNALYPAVQSGAMDLYQWRDALVEIHPDLKHKNLDHLLSFLSTHQCLRDNIVEIRQGMEMGILLSELSMDPDSVVAGLLFRFVHSSAVDVETVEKEFGPKIKFLIQNVIKMDAIRGFFQRFEGRQEKESAEEENRADALRKMLLAMVADVRVVVIRLCEHLCDLRSASKASFETQRNIAKETRLIYAPLANRLGIGQLKWEMEDLAFRYLEPETYKQIAGLLDEKRIDRDRHIEQVISDIRAVLGAHDIPAAVSGRVKHIYSIWRKMQRKNLDYGQLYDIRAVRILTDSVAQCYAVLGIVHSLWRHIPKEFDDYIAIPKDNGYQSLHTAVLGPGGKTLEIQIRTHQMHKESELGVAAHWRYKEGSTQDKSVEGKIAWLRQLLAWQDEWATATEVMEEFKVDISEERVYALTPQGDVIGLPEGATPIDFAYQVHTGLGHSCRGAKINGKMVALNEPLHHGDVVEILTRKDATPSRDWLNPHFGFARSPRTRAKIQAWFKKQHFDENVLEGRQLLEKELEKLGVDSLDWRRIENTMHFKKQEDVLAALGRGDIRISHILQAARIEIRDSGTDRKKLPLVKPTAPSASHLSGIVIAGVGDLLTTLAACCKPILGHPIVGFITQGRGITVHCEDCTNVYYLKETYPERMIDVSWGGRPRQFVFAVDIFILSRDRQGLLRDMTSLISAEKLNILNLNTKTDKQDIVHTQMTLEVQGLDDLTKILDRLQKLPNVLEIRRMRSAPNMV